MAEDRVRRAVGEGNGPFFFPGSNNVIIDLFAGGGGASVGIEAATGLDVDIAVNHDATALAVHAANQAARVFEAREPLRTVTATGSQGALVSAFLAKHFGGVVGIPATAPVSTITNRDHHSLVEVAQGTGDHTAEVRAFLTAYYSSGSVGQRADKPLRTVTAKHRLGLVTVSGVDYQIVDIGMRMLEPHELLRAQFGRFAADYDLSAATTKSAKVRLIGNSVAPEVAEAVVRANWRGAAKRRAA